MKVLWMISVMMLVSDCDNFALWVTWEIVWFTVFMITSYKLINEGEER